MKTLYEKSFLKDIEKVKDKKILDRLSETIDSIKSATALRDLKNIKKLSGHSDAFRIKMGDYRIGFFFENETVIFSRFLNRKDIYNYFP